MVQQKSIIEPELTDVLVNFKQDIFSTLNCVRVGQISQFDGTKRLAQVQILSQRVLPDGTVKSYPLLINCPVFTLQGGGGSIQFPIAIGDQCLLLFNDRRLDEWIQNGGQQPPGDGRMHDMSDAICLVGLNALNSDLPIYPTDKVVLSYKGVSLNLLSTGVAFLGTGGAEIDLAAGIITLKNNTTTLLTLMNSFITLLEAAAVQDDEGGNILPFTPAYIALLEAFKLQFASLLG